MPSNISWPLSCFYNAWRSICCGFVSEALQLCAHIKYSCQLPYRLKRSMPLDLSGLGGKADYRLDTQTAIVWKKKTNTKLVLLCLGYFCSLWQYSMMAFREAFYRDLYQRAISPKILHASIFASVSFFPIEGFYCCVHCIHACLTLCCVICSNSHVQYQHILIISSPKVIAQWMCICNYCCKKKNLLLSHS